MFTPPPNAGYCDTCRHNGRLCRWTLVESGAQGRCPEWHDREANCCHVCGCEAKRLDSGLCLLCSLIRRLASDTEPTLSSDRDTRTEHE